MTIEQWLAAAEAAEKSATPAPWKHVPGTLKHYVASTDDREEFGIALQDLHWRDGGETRAEQNAALIAAMRNREARVLALIHAAADALRTADEWLPPGHCAMEKTGPLRACLKALTEEAT